MAGLKLRGKLFPGSAYIAGLRILLVGLVFLVMACTGVLDLKDLVKQEVALSKVGLTLFDGASPIAPGSAVSFNATIFGDTFTKTLTLTNNGTSNVTLSSPLIVSKTGGSGSAAYGNIVQPAILTLLPGASTTFTIDYTPPSPDSDYIADFVINSDDRSYPAYTFHGSGHSTQWHGSLPIVSSAASTLSFSKPKLAYLAGSPATLYVAYKVYDSVTAANCGIALRYSTDGGKN